MHYSAPGKLMISGEWSVLESSACMVAAIDRRVHCVVEKGNSKDISVSIDDFGINLQCRFDGKSLIFHKDIKNINEKIKFIKAAIETALIFLLESNIEIKPFSVRACGEETNIMVDGKQKKIGFGSSAAATVAAVAGILAFHGYRAGKGEIFKLAAIANYAAQGKAGSGFDIAASAYGGMIAYRRFDAGWLERRSGAQVKNIVKEKWPSLRIEELKIPDDFILLAGWTGESASTPAMIRQMNEFKAGKAEEYGRLIKAISGIAAQAIDAFRKGGRKKFLSSLQKNEAALADLGKASGVNIETPELKKLSEIANACGAAGKLSGAGGGDCGIAVCYDKAIARKVRKEWQSAGLRVIDVCVDDGARKELK